MLPKKPKILLSLHHVYSKRDTAGNVYWITYATSTISGKTMSFDSPSDSNSNSVAREATGGKFGRFTNTQEMIGSREYWRRHKTIDLHNSCHDQDIVDALRKLAIGE